MLIQHNLTPIILSSIPNYLVVNGLVENTPSTITFSGITGNAIRFILSNNTETDTFVGSTTALLTDKTFNTTSNSLISLYECLKMNSTLFSEIQLNIASGNIICNITSGYSVNSSTGISVVITNRDTALNKTVVLIGDNIELSKYHYTSSIKFNLSDPFNNITFFEPKTLSLYSYTITDSVVTTNAVMNTISILPTTLNLHEWVVYDDYTLTSGELTLKNILTNRRNSYYNYNEEIILSVLAQSQLTLSINVKFYTGSGVFITSITPSLITRYVRPRFDIRFTPDLLTTELAYNNEIGYFTVEVLQGATVKTRPLKFIVNPKCVTNNVFYFVNKIGGLDSFNFLKEESMKSSIDNQVTYIKNIEFNGINEGEYVHSKSYFQKFTAETTLLDKEQAEYITELAKSKYVYKYVDNIKTIVIIDKCDVNINTDNGYNISIEYHYSDSKV